MTDIKDLSSTAIYAWTTLVSVLICVPGALIFEGPKLQAGIDAALKKEPNFYLSLLSVGLLYHLYNQVRAQACILCHRMSKHCNRKHHYAQEHLSSTVCTADQLLHHHTATAHLFMKHYLLHWCMYGSQGVHA